MADVVVVLQDVERVGGERRKVEHALLGLQVVADGGWLHMLHGSATVVLEAVMDYKQLVLSLLHHNDRLASTY